MENLAKPLHDFLTTSDEVGGYVQSNFYDNCMHHYNVEILNLFNLELQLFNTKSLIKNKLIHASTIMPKIRNYASEYWIALDIIIIIKHNIKIFGVLL